MDIIGNGVDIVENRRIKKSLKLRGFINRIFTKSEINKSKKLKNKINYFAKRFAAKEAFAKALGEGFRNNINFNDIDVTNDKKGNPRDLTKATMRDNAGNCVKNNKPMFLLAPPPATSFQECKT